MNESNDERLGLGEARQAMTTVKFLLFAVLAACACEQSAAPASDEAGLLELIDAHDEAWNAHDPTALAALFEDGGTLVTPRGDHIQGRDSLQQSFAQPGPTKQTRSSSRLDRIQWIADDLVLIDATQTLSGPGVARIGAAEAKLAAVARRVDATWRFVAVRLAVEPTH
jgi:uncharacterized protein (TIGR02246 family)